MKKAGQLPADWQLSQCLFGEHLLALYQGKPVGLVESEKTAVIAAGLMPKYMWLATGGHPIPGPFSVLPGSWIRSWPMMWRSSG